MSEHTKGKPERFNAYYFSFDATGCKAIDNILSLVARAGKAYHNTSYWNDYEDGSSFIEQIQDAAQSANDKYDALTQQRDDLLAACEKGAKWMMWLKLRGQCECEPNSRCVKCVVTDELVVVEAAIAAAKE